MTICVDQLYETPQQHRMAVEVRRAEARHSRKVTLAHTIKPCIVCPMCGRLFEIHGRFTTVDNYAQRLWPCGACGNDGSVPQVQYFNPINGQLMDRARFDELTT